MTKQACKQEIIQQVNKAIARYGKRVFVEEIVEEAIPNVKKIKSHLFSLSADDVIQLMDDMCKQEDVYVKVFETFIYSWLRDGNVSEEWREKMYDFWYDQNGYQQYAIKWDIEEEIDVVSGEAHKGLLMNFYKGVVEITEETFHSLINAMKKQDLQMVAAIIEEESEKRYGEGKGLPSHIAFDLLEEQNIPYVAEETRPESIYMNYFNEELLSLYLYDKEKSDEYDRYKHGTDLSVEWENPYDIHHAEHVFEEKTLVEF